jgi:hypothetical protein
LPKNASLAISTSYEGSNSIFTLSFPFPRKKKGKEVKKGKKAKLDLKMELEPDG